GRRWPRPRGGSRAAKRLLLERLEDRTLLSGADTLRTALPLSLTASGTAQAGHFLAAPNEGDLYRVHLGAGARVSASLTAQTAGSGLQSLLRVFRSDGSPLALDDQEGGDPQLTFQTSTAGDYYVGVSSAGNDAYDPTRADSGRGGATTGLYTLNLRA